jgi:uncharacterized membrane-anchored protein
MRLFEIKQGNAAEERLKRLKDVAKVQKDKANQLTNQVNTSADQLKLKQARQKVAQPRTSGSTSTIKPHA